MRIQSVCGLAMGTLMLIGCGAAHGEAAPASSASNAQEAARPQQPGYPRMGATSSAPDVPVYPSSPQPAEMDMAPSAGASAAGWSADSSAARAPMAPPPPPAPPSTSSTSMARPEPATKAILAQQSGAVKAGEWDDNANYREFQRYLASEEGTGFHAADVRDRKFIVVRDAQGKGVPRCRVTIADARQHSVTLTTTASGRAILFPHAEGLTGAELSATTQCQGQTARAGVPSAADGIVDLKLNGARALPSRTIDVAFILDTTGSMGEEIAAVKSTIEKVTSALDASGQLNVKVRIGMVEFKDRTDEHVTRVHPMTTDVRRFAREITGIVAEGGGDTPESVNAGVHAGLNDLDWSDDAVAKIAFLIGDAPPHLDYANDADYAVDMKDAAHRGIQLFTIAASGMDDLGQVVWRQMAQYTGATNMFVLRGGAGPQSTGAGDPKSSCGGTQSAYASGNLDGLILAKIRGEVHALDRDPMKIPGRGQDENAKPCADRVLMLD